MKPENQTSVLMIGPLPPPPGGATVLFKELNTYLHSADDIQCETIDTTFRGKGEISRSLFSLVLLFKIIQNIHKHDVAFFNASLRGAYQFGVAIKLICLVFRKPWGFRGFGGNYYDWYVNTSPIKKWLLRNGILSADMVLFETKELINNFPQVINANYIWYPNSRYIKCSNIKNNRCQNLVFIGHVKPEKGVHELISIADYLPPNVTIDVYGPILDGAKESDFISNSISYKGVLEPKLVLDTLSKYDALVFPTYYEGEGYPGVILEAYSCGLPVVTTRWKMIPEIVDEESGILIEPKNTKQLLEAISKISSDSEHYEKLRKGAIKKAQLYDMRTWNRTFIDLCDQLNRLRD